MKLISMTDFVLERSEKIKKEKYGIESYYNTMQVSINYANFLKQLLKLEMFVPCDEDGNVLEKPSAESYIILETCEYSKEWIAYKKAKEKVLFEGFCINGEDENIITLEFENTWIEFYKEHEVFMYGNYALIDVEDLSNFELQLTESALKQIEL